MRTNRGRIAAFLLGLAFAATAGYAFDLPQEGNPSVRDGGLYAVKSGTANTKQSLESINGALVVSPVQLDPCQSPAVTKSSVAIAATADAQLVALSGSTVIYVCGFNFTLAGTAPSARFITGTGSVCATGTVNETGVMLPTVGLNLLSGGGGYTIFAGAAGAALCIDVGGTTPSAQGVLTFVQQ